MANCGVWVAFVHLLQLHVFPWAVLSEKHTENFRSEIFRVNNFQVENLSDAPYCIIYLNKYLMSKIFE